MDADLEFIIKVGLYAKEYAKGGPPKLGRGFGHANDVLEAVRIRKRYVEGLQTLYARLTSPNAASLAQSAMSKFEESAGADYASYDPQEIRQLVGEAIFLATGETVLALPVEDRFISEEARDFARLVAVYMAERLTPGTPEGGFAHAHTLLEAAKAIQALRGALQDELSRVPEKERNYSVLRVVALRKFCGDEVSSAAAEKAVDEGLALAGLYKDGTPPWTHWPALPKIEIGFDPDTYCAG